MARMRRTGRPERVFVDMAPKAGRSNQISTAKSPRIKPTRFPGANLASSRYGIHFAVVQFIHDQVKGTGRNSFFWLSHRLAAAWSRIWSKRAPKGLHFGPNCPLYSVENKGTPGLNRRLLIDGLSVRFLLRPPLINPTSCAVRS